MRRIQIAGILCAGLFCLLPIEQAFAQRGGNALGAEAASVDSCPTNLSYVLTSPQATKNQGYTATFQFKLNTGTRKVSRVEVAVTYQGTDLSYELPPTISGYPKPWGSNNWDFEHSPSKQCHRQA